MRHQLTLVPEVEPDTWTTDDWNTPEPVAKLMQAVLERELPNAHISELLESDGSPCMIKHRVLEIGAGSGEITRHADFDRWNYMAIEPKQGRWNRGNASVRSAQWYHVDYLNFKHEPVGGVIGNLPFSIAMSLIKHAATMLWFHGCMVLLLPTAFFQTQKRGKQLESIGLHITAEIRLRGRVAYERNGEAVKGRQCEDSIFVLRFDRGAIEIVDPYDRQSVTAWREAQS
jgi:hypothetical protein